MGLLGSMTVTFGANIDNLQSGVGRAQGLLQSLASGNWGGVVAGGFAIAGQMALDFGQKSLHAAGDFESMMTDLVTGAGESQKKIGMVADGILALAPAVGATTQQLHDSMFMIESSGQHGEQALLTLKDVAEGAKVGVASFGDVANGVTTAMTDYSASGLTAAQATNDLIATVADGKTHMGDLARAMSTILPTAAAVHVGLYDVSGAMATMTGEGTSAASAATYLRQLLMALEAPAAKGAKALASVGLTTQEVSDSMKKSLPDTLKMITDAVANKFPPGSAAYVEALKNISGGAKQMQGILELSGPHLATFHSNVDGITSAVQHGGNTIVGFNLVQHDFNFKMAQAAAAAQVLSIKVGFGLMEAFSVVTDKITATVTAIGNVISFFQKNQWAADALMGILAGLTYVIIAMNASAIMAAITAIPELVLGFGAWAIAAASAAIATIAATWPIIAVGAIIALVVTGIILAVQHWGAIWNWLKGVWGAAVGFFEMIGQGISHAFGAIGTFFANTWNGVVATFKGGVNFIISLVNDMIGFLDSFHISIPSINIGPIHTPGFDFGLNIPKIPMLAQGAQNFSGGWAIVGEHGPEYVQLPQGSNVYPNGSSPGGDIHVHVYFDGNELTGYQAERMVSMIRSEGPVGRVA